MYVYDKMGLRNDSVYSGERSCEEAEPDQGLEEATMDGSMFSRHLKHCLRIRQHL